MQVWMIWQDHYTASPRMPLAVYFSESTARKAVGEMVGQVEGSLALTCVEVQDEPEKTDLTGAGLVSRLDD